MCIPAPVAADGAATVAYTAHLSGQSRGAATLVLGTDAAQALTAPLESAAAGGPGPGSNDPAVGMYLDWAPGAAVRVPGDGGGYNWTGAGSLGRVASFPGARVVSSPLSASADTGGEVVAVVSHNATVWYGAGQARARRSQPPENATAAAALLGDPRFYTVRDADVPLDGDFAMNASAAHAASGSVEEAPWAPWLSDAERYAAGFASVHSASRRASSSSDGDRGAERTDRYRPAFLGHDPAAADPTGFDPLGEWSSVGAAPRGEVPPVQGLADWDPSLAPAGRIEPSAEAHFLERSGVGAFAAEGGFSAALDGGTAAWASAGPEGIGAEHCGAGSWWLAGSPAGRASAPLLPGGGGGCAVPSPIAPVGGVRAQATLRSWSMLVPGLLLRSLVAPAGTEIVGVAFSAASRNTYVVAATTGGAEVNVTVSVVRGDLLADGDVSGPYDAPLPAPIASVVLPAGVHIASDTAVAAGAAADDGGGGHTDRVLFLATNLTSSLPPAAAGSARARRGAGRGIGHRRVAVADDLLGTFVVAVDSDAPAPGGASFAGFARAPRGATTLAACGTPTEPCATGGAEYAAVFASAASGSGAVVHGSSIRGAGGAALGEPARNASCDAARGPAAGADCALSPGDAGDDLALGWGPAVLVGSAEVWAAAINASAISSSSSSSSSSAARVSWSLASSTGGGGVAELRPTGFAPPSAGDRSASTAAHTWSPFTAARPAMEVAGPVSVSVPVYSATLSYIAYVMSPRASWPLRPHGYLIVQIVRRDGRLATGPFPSMSATARLVSNETDPTDAGPGAPTVGPTEVVDLGNGTLAVRYNATTFGAFFPLIEIDDVPIGGVAGHAAAGENLVVVDLSERPIPELTWFPDPPAGDRVYHATNASFVAQLVSNLGNMTYSPDPALLYSVEFEVYFNASLPATYNASAPNAPGSLAPTSHAWDTIFSEGEPAFSQAQVRVPNVTWIDRGDGTFLVDYVADRVGLYQVRSIMNGVPVVAVASVVAYRGWNARSTPVRGPAADDGEFYVGATSLELGPIVDEYGRNVTATPPGVAFSVELLPADDATARAVAASLNITGFGNGTTVITAAAHGALLPSLSGPARDNGDGTWTFPNLTQRVPGFYSLAVYAHPASPRDAPRVPLRPFPRTIEVLTDVAGLEVVVAPDLVAAEVPPGAGPGQGPAPVAYHLRLLSKPRSPYVNVTAAGVVDPVTREPQLDVLNGTETVTIPRGAWRSLHAVVVRGSRDWYDEDDVHHGVIAHAVLSSDALDPGYGPGLAVDTFNVTVNVSDADTAAILLSPSAGPFAVLEGSGSPALVEVTLASRPYANVTVDTASLGVDASIAPPSLLFSRDGAPGTSAWSVPVTVTIGAIDDSFVEPAPEVETLAFTARTEDPAADPWYAGTHESSVSAVAINATAIVTDDDSAGLFVAPLAFSCAEDGSANATVTVRPTARPLPGAVVVVDVSGGSQLIVHPARLTFTDAAWNASVPIQVRAVDDRVGEDDPHDGQVTFSIDTAATTDPSFDLVADVVSAATIAEDDPVNEIVTPVPSVYWDRDAVIRLDGWITFASGDSVLPVTAVQVRIVSGGASLVGSPVVEAGPGGPTGAVLTSANVTWRPEFGPAAAGSAVVEFRLELQGGAAMTAWVPFTLTVLDIPAPVVTAVAPPGSPLAGGVAVDVYGVYLGLLARAAVNVTDVSLAGVSCGPSAVLLSSSHVRCTAAPSPAPVAGPVTVDSTQGAALLPPGPAAVAFAYYTPEVTAITPASVPGAVAASGSAAITLHGSGLGLDAADAVSAAVAGVPCQVPLQWDNSSHVVCLLAGGYAGAMAAGGPVSGPAVFTSALAGDGSGPPALDILSPLITAVEPESHITRVSGGARVTIFGSNFRVAPGDVPESVYLAGVECSALTSFLAPAAPGDPERLVCTRVVDVPEARGPEIVRVNTTLGGLGRAAPGPPVVAFEWLPAPDLSTVANLSSVVDVVSGLAVPGLVATASSVGDGPFVLTLPPGQTSARLSPTCVDGCSAITVTIVNAGTGEVLSAAGTTVGSGGRTPEFEVPPEGVRVTFLVVPEDALAPPRAYEVIVRRVVAGDKSEVLSVTPSSGPSGGGYVVTVKGSKLGRGPGDITGVLVAGVPCIAVSWLGPGQFTCTAGRSAAGSQSGRVEVTIASLGPGTADNSSPLAVFTYLYPSPTISNARPRVVKPEGGTVIEVRGDYFGVADPSVTGEPLVLAIEGVPCTVTEWISETLLKCMVPPRSAMPTGEPNMPLVARVGPRSSNPTFVGFTRGFRFGIECDPVCPWNTECVGGECGSCLPGFTGAPECSVRALDFSAASPSEATSEDGDIVTVEVTLRYREALSEPIILALETTDATEAVLPAPQVTFTSEDYLEPRTITVSPVADAVRDGNVSYALVPRFVSAPVHFTAGPDLPRIPLVNLDSLPVIESVLPEVIPLDGRRATITGRHFDLFFALDVDANPVTSVARVSNGSLYITATTGTTSSSSSFSFSPESPLGLLQDVTADVVEGDFPAREEGYHVLTLVNDLGSRVSTRVYYTDDCPEPGFFGRGIDCAPCPDGGECPGGFRIRPLSGYWNPSEDSGYIVSCEPAEACLGFDEDSGLALCATGYEGFACSQCVEGFVRGVTGACDPCPQGEEQNIMMIADAVMWILFGLAVCNVESERSLGHVTQLVLTLQMVGQIGKSVSSTLPGWLLAMYKVFRLFSGEIDFVSPDCYGRVPFSTKFFYSIGYLAIIGMPMYVFLFIGRFVSERRFRKHGVDHAEARVERYKARFVRALFTHFWIVYLPLSANAAGALMCTPVGGEGLRLLADPETKCFEGIMIAVHSIAGVAAFSVVLGFPVWYVIYFRKHRLLAFTSRSFRRRYDIMYEPFRPRWWYFYNLELASSLAIAVADGVLTQHPNMQFYTMASAFGAQLIFTIVLHPFAAGWENAWQVNAIVVNLIAIGTTFVTKYDLVGGGTVKIITYAFAGLLAILISSILLITLYCIFWKVDAGKYDLKSDRLSPTGDDAFDDEKLTAELGGFLGVEDLVGDPSGAAGAAGVAGAAGAAGLGGAAAGYPGAMGAGDFDDGELGWMEWLQQMVGGAWSSTMEAAGLQDSRDEAATRALREEAAAAGAAAAIGDNPGEIRTVVTMGARGGEEYIGAPTGSVEVVDADRAKSVLGAAAAAPPAVAAGPAAAGLVLQRQQQPQQPQQPLQQQQQHPLPPLRSAAMPPLPGNPPALGQGQGAAPAVAPTASSAPAAAPRAPAVAPSASAPAASAAPPPPPPPP